MAIRPPTMPFRSKMWMSGSCGVVGGEYKRRKWAREEPAMPPPMMHMVGWFWREGSGEKRRRRVRKERIFVFGNIMLLCRPAWWCCSCSDRSLFSQKIETSQWAQKKFSAESTETSQWAYKYNLFFCHIIQRLMEDSVGRELVFCGIMQCHLFSKHSLIWVKRATLRQKVWFQIC